MSQLRLANETDLTSFPGCHSVVVDTPPITQCQESQIDESAGTIAAAEYTITDVGTFAAIDLTGKKVTVTAPVGEAGTYNVISNNGNVLTTDHEFGEASDLTAYTIHDEAQTYLTRNESSFVRFLKSLGNAHTFLNGQLYTDVQTGPLSAACSDTYNPD